MSSWLGHLLLLCVAIDAASDQQKVSFHAEQYSTDVSLLQVGSTKRHRKAQEPSTKIISQLQLNSDGLNNLVFARRPEALPDVIVQWGHARTATTLQFNTLCAIMTMIHEDHPDQVDCYFYDVKKHLSQLNAYMANVAGIRNVTIKKKFEVIKIHEQWQLLEFVPPLMKRNVNVWLFATAKNASLGYEDITDWEPTSEALSRRLGSQVMYTQVFELLRVRDMSITADYKSMFGLSDRQMDALMEYVKLWDILRQCCGTQMSKGWRAVLQNRSYSYPGCNIYDIAAVESSFVNTSIFRQFSAQGPHDLLQVSCLDYDGFGPLDGTYCPWVNRQIGCQGLQFNQYPKQPYC